MSAEQPDSQPFRIDTLDGGMLCGDVAGSADAPPVVLLHGYPDTRLIWRRVAARLATDHRVIRYDVRGAGDSFAPAAVGGYALHRLAADFGAVLDAATPDRPAHVVAHDWGAIQAWEAVTDPAFVGRIASFTSISGPCLDHVGHWLRRRARAGDLSAVAGQLAKSWYIGAFHLPLLPALTWRLGLGRRWPSVMKALEDVRADRDPTQSDTGRQGTALYRANVLPRLLRPRERRTEVPVQLVVPTRDRFVQPALADSAAPWIGRRRRVEVDAGHWLPLSHPDWLAQRIREFAAQAADGSVPPSAARNDSGRVAADPLPC